MRPSPRPIRDEGRVASAWVMSIVGHLVATGLGGLLMASTLGRKPALPVQAPPAAQVQLEDAVEIELPAMLDGSRADQPVPPPAPLPEALARGGGEGKPALDTGREGRGGTDTAEAPAVNLADRDDGTLLTPEVRNRLDRDQIQRIQASKKRASREDWRASREPMELTFVAEGPHERPTRMDRRHGALRDPSSGGRDHGAPRRAGGALGAAMLPPGFGENPRVAGAPSEGADRASAGAGIRDGAPGWDHRDAARGALARPMVNEGSPSVPANAPGRPTDNVDAEQEVASAMQSIVHASTAGGAPGAGTGGQHGPGPAGAGGQSGPGSQSRALGSGHGSGVDQDPRDKRRLDYMRQVIAKLGPYTQPRKLMPPAAALEGAQGVVIVTFTIRADGAVAGASITRTSGIPELDENFRKAILQAAPFPALPAELGPTFRWAMPLDMRNPAVRPRNAKTDRPSEG
jgi:TonB family protein